MKIAIVHDFLTKIGGAEKVLLEITKIFPDAPIFTLLYDQEGTKSYFSEKNIITSYLNKYPRSIVKSKKFLLSKFPQAIESFDFSEYDIVISSSNSYAHGIITKPSTLHICYSHSPMRFVWDWYHEYLSENKIGFSPIGLYIRKLLHDIRIWDFIAVDRVDYWLANSRNSADRIKKYYKKASTIIYPPVNLESISPSFDLPDDYYLIVSRLEPYKKIDFVIDTFNKNRKNLVIIGEGSDKSRLKKLAKDSIEFLGWQSDQSVHEYMKNAKALIFPGEEDFGITPIESLASGRPVIAYDKGGVKESITTKTGVFFSEQNEDSLNVAVRELEKNYINFSPHECRNQAEKFSNAIFTKQLMEFVEEKQKEYFDEK